MDKTQIEKLLDMPLSGLLARADAVRRAHFAPAMDLCGIVNAKSGLCSEDCKFCAQSSQHCTGIDTYPLKDEAALFEAASQAQANGAGRFGIVSSGNSLSRAELTVLAGAVRRIRRKLNLEVCGSLGALDRESLQLLRDSGMSRYHHNIETSPSFYPRIVTTHSFQQRIETIVRAQQCGFEVCSGGIIGLGESWQDRIEMALLLRSLKVDSVPLNILVPIKGTALEKNRPLSCSEIVRTIALFRIVLEDKVIRIAAGRESVLADFQALAFMAGANGMLIGGYLTVKGRGVDVDHRLVAEMENLWSE